MKRMLKLRLLFIPLTMPFLFACGNVLTNRNLPMEFTASKGQSSGYDAEAFISDETEDGEFTCPKAANVKPKYDWDLDGSNFYHVCPSSKTSSKVLIRGLPGDKEPSNMICIFPVNVSADRPVFVNTDSSGGPMVQCGFAQEDGLEANFSSSNSTAIFNAVIIVERHNLEQMQRCLNPDPNSGGTNFYYCPRYSYGPFR